MPATRDTAGPAHIPLDASDPPRIRPLPDLLVNQIAAGEVVERPASVVKELVDNALDAGATRITIELEAGGVELVRVADDGRGVPPEDLPLALAPHATSKIAHADDLDAIATLGFRGEALASIASVARVSIRSRPAGAADAYRIDAEGERVGEPRPDAGAPGTVVTVRTLFFNTPARRKFLRTPGTERGHCVEAVKNLALAHPAVGFTLTADGGTVLDLPPAQTLRDRAQAILGDELADRLIEVSSDDADTPGVIVWGLVGEPALAKPTAHHQRLFVNGRPVRDRAMQHALAEAFRGLIDPARKPLAAILVDMDPARVDVNVHPAKAEVRFRDPGLVHSAIYHAVKRALALRDLTPAWTDVRRAAGATPEPVVRPGAWSVPPAFSAARFADEIKTHLASVGAEVDRDALRVAVERAAPPDPDEPDALPPARAAGRVLQVHDSYLVTQDDAGVLIIDQHALHERVMFEKIMSRLGSGPLESQRLLTPAVVDATPAMLEALSRLTPTLARLGVEAEPIGPRAVAVQAFPTLLFNRKVEPAPFLADLLERAAGRGDTPTDEEALHEVVDMMACKAAVKAGDRLTDDELAEILAMRDRVERSSSCPHGRPTSIRLSLADLERRFGRR